MSLFSFARLRSRVTSCRLFLHPSGSVSVTFEA